MHIGQQFSPLKISSSNPIDNMMKDKNPTSRPTSDGQQPRTAPQLPMTKQVLYETLAREPVTQETINLGNTEVNLVHFTPGAIEHKLFDTPAPLASSMSYLRVGPAAHLGWSEVSFSLSQKAAGKRDPAVLRAISGAARPGDVIALLGPSGSGKTSLLNVLSGRITSMGGHKVHARITINGRIMSAQELGPKVAYVMQEDALHPTSTPREALAFSAALRLPPSVTPEQREVMVEAIISLLRLVCSFAGALCCVRSECPCLRKQASCFFGEGRFRQALTF
jgi:ABC-type glutathione transport system ATPase component